jgi:transposase
MDTSWTPNGRPLADRVWTGCASGSADGLSRDVDAVAAGLSTPWSSGQVEGQATRKKLLKRQECGPVNLYFLRKRVLLTP